jgi:tetratricopeptide (TPR) repeat protein
MRLIAILFLLFTISAHSQVDLANDYFQKGEFEKALVIFKKLEKEKNYNISFKQKIVEIYQQLEQLNEAERYLLSSIENNNNPILLVELGYNYELKANKPKALEYYALAELKLENKPSIAYILAKTYENHSLLKRAAHVYTKAMELNPALNYNINLARIYGEQGNIENMFNSYMNFIQSNPNYTDRAKRAISDFISEDSQSENNLILKKILLKKIQQEPDLLWNELLSWLFVQQKDYTKAFAQEKAIFKRNPESLKRIIDLALITLDEKENETAKGILNYLIETAQDVDTNLKANNYLIELETQDIIDGNYKKIGDKYQELFKTFGYNNKTVELQLSYAHFLAFHLEQPENAITFLKQSLELPLNNLQTADLKLKLGDILVYQEKFNEALIYYTQIQRNLKNSTISQEARFRIAKTSYYKGDFSWAESQLKILKSSTSQLIANDALDLKLLISDNILEDSTQTALKLYAKADLLAFQNKTKKAIDILDTVLNNHKDETIVDQALYMQAQLFEKTKQYSKAEANYLSIISNHKEDILIDDAYFKLAELYSSYFNLPEKAKQLYEQILFNHQDSIYYVDARKKYRALRGDSIN